MRSNTSISSARRTRRHADRRSRRRPAIIATGLAIGLLATAGFTATAPASVAEASGSTTHFALASFTPTTHPTPTATVSGTDEVSTDAREALAAADASITAAGSVTADIAASGLDVGTVDTTVDTAALEAAVDRLESADSLPAPFVPELTDDVTVLVASIDGQVGGLRESLDAAVALKAEQEAAAQAQREAEAAAAEAEAEAAAAAEASTSAPSSAPAPVYATGGVAGDNSPAGAQASARAMLGNYGWGDDQFGCLVSLWNKESGWNYQAHNSSSGAHGIPQALPGSKMASAGADWQTNAATQVAWGLGYISGRYGSPCAAWSHSQSVGWY